MLQIGKAYFEGYEEKFSPRKNGRGYKKIRVYTGDVYHPELTEKQWGFKKLLFTFLILGFFVLLFCGGSIRTTSNQTALVTLPYIAALLSGGYCSVGVMHFLTKKTSMTVFGFKEFRGQVLRGSAAAAIAMGLTCAANLAVIAVGLLRGGRGAQWVGTEFTVMLCNLCGCFAMYGIHAVEKAARYTVTPGRPPEEADAPISGK